MIELQWDEANLRHIGRHSVSVKEFTEVLLNDPIELEMQDHAGEIRHSLLGETLQGRVLLVVVTERGEHLRPITAYTPNSMMRRRYVREKGVNHEQ